MKILSVFRRYVLFAVSMVALLGLATPAFATHLRGGTVSWRVTGTTVSNGTVTAYTVQFTLVESSRWSYPGTAGTCGTVNQQSGTCPALNTSVSLSTLTGGTFTFGDGQSVVPTGTVTSINQAQDYLTATFVFSHTYSSSYQNVKAYFEAGNRISTLKIGHDQLEYIYTIVQNYTNGSPTAATPAILAVPLQNSVTFNLSTVVTDIDPNATLVYRLATLAELYGPNVTSVPCPSGVAYTSPAPPGFTISSAGQVTWLTTLIQPAVSGGNCGLGAPAAGDLWPVQIMVEAHDKTTNALLTETPIDLLMDFINPVGALPTVTLNPSTTQTVSIGTPVTFTATGSSSNSGAKVTLNASGIPSGATATGLNASVTPPAISNFSWTPGAGQNGTYVVTYTVTDSNLQQATASNTIVVATLPTITCAAPLSVTYGQTGTLSTSVFDSNEEVLNVVWALDGTNVQTNSNVTAYPNPGVVQLQQTFGKAGSHTVKVTATDPHGVAVSCTTPVTVNQAPASVTVNPASKVYGTADPSFSGTLSGFLPADNITATYSRVSGETVAGGPYTISATLSPTTAVSNYNVTYNAAALTITPAPSLISLSCPASVTYNGLPQTPCSATVTGVGGLNQVVTVSYSANVNVGVVTASATYAGDANHAASTNSTTFTVLPAAQVITFTPVPTSPDTAGDSVVLSATGGASGQPVVFSVLSGNATLANDGVTLTYTGAGTVVVAADQAASADGNYAAATEATATIVVNPVAAAYNAGTVPVAQQSNVLTATLNFPNGGTIGSLNYLTQGAPNLDFIGNTSTGWNHTTNRPANDPIPLCSVGSAYAAGQICQVYYIFQPQYPGQRLGAITAVDSNGNTMGTSYLSGLGSGPLATFTPGTISTVAGGGTGSDGGLAINSSFSSSYGVAVDGAGNLYIADRQEHRVRKVTAATGFISTVAGNGTEGYNGDNQAATSAELRYPEGVAIDGAGNLYIADRYNARIRKVDVSTGLISTVAGGGPGLDGGVATTAGLGCPTGITVDAAGNLYIADPCSLSIRKVTASTGLISTVAGNGAYGYFDSQNTGTTAATSASLEQPYGVAVDGAGNLYIADQFTNRIRKVTAATGFISTVAGNGMADYAGDGAAATSAALNYPTGVALDAAGNLYIADYVNGSLRKVTAATGIITTVAGSGVQGVSGDGDPATSARLGALYGITLDGAGNLYATEISGRSTHKVTATAAPLSFADTNVGSPSSDSPATVIVSNNGYDPTSTNPLTFSGVLTGTTNFVLDTTNACSNSTSLEPGQTCALAVDFTPQTSGTPLTDAVTLADNNLNNINSASSPQTVALSGNGLQQTPGVTVAPATITYGTSTVALSATVSFVGSIAPTGAVSFTIDSGSAVVASCTGTTSPLTCTASYPSGTLGVPTHTITAGIAATPGFLVSSGTNTLTVTPAALTVTAGSYTGVYDGATHALSTCTVSANFDSLTCTNNPVGPVGPDAGGTVVTPVISGSTANYTVTANNGAWSITQASSVTALTCPASVVYNGTAQTPCTATVTGAGGLSQSVTVTYGANTIVGTASASATFAGDANHTSSTKSTTFAITPAALTVTAGSYSGVYDGNSHALSACVVSSNPDNLTCTNNPVGPVGPNVGGSTVTPVVSGSTSNYTVTAVNGAWSIMQASSVTALTCPASVVYNGTAQTPCTATVTGAGGLSQSVTVTYGANTIVGTASASATFAGDANHTSSTKSTTFAITPAPLTVTAGSYSGTYDGAAHALSGCVVSSNPDGLTCTNSPATVGPDVGSGTVTPLISGSTDNYSVTKNNGSWSIMAKAVTISAGSYSGTYDGAAHAPSACASSYAGVTCANSPASVGPGVGSGAINPVPSFPTGNATDYTVTKTAGSYTITKLAASVTPNATTKVFGTADPVLSGSLSGFLPADGVTATYSRTSGETVAGSPYTISATLSPTAVLSNYAITSNTAAFTITKATPILTWTNPAGITYGTPLSATQLNATSNLTGGTFAYTPSSGTVLTAGSQTLSVVYTPVDTADYTTATASVPLTVGQATPVVTWANPPSIVYGTGTGAAQKTATATGVGGVSLPGTFFYTTPDGTIFGVGTHPLGVAFTPTDSTDYVPVSAYAYITVTKATPTVTWAAPAAITYGTALSSAQLNATASVPGSFSYSPAAGTVLHAGSQTLSVTFTPTDTSNYNPVTTTVPLTVNKATPVITWPTPASITYGTPLSVTQLNATANVPGTFAYTASTGANPLGVLLPPGTTALSATITPTDTVDYNSATAYVVFTVSKAQTTTTLAVTTTQTVTGTTATITATVKPQIGGTPTGTVTYYNGSTTLGSSAVGTPFTTGVLPVGTDPITAVYSGDSNFVGSSSSATAVTSIAPTTVQLSSPLAHVFYPASAVSFTVIVPLKNLQLISGTITLYDGNTVIGTYSLPIGGVLAGVTPQLSVGTHTLRAVYGGNAQYPPGQSPVVTVTVSAL